MDCYYEMPSYSDLPMDMILYIFHYLKHDDRQSAGATCRRWHEALSFAEMNRNIMAHFYKMPLSDDDAVIQSFINSSRHINTFLFEDIRFGDASQFLKKISRMARAVIFKSVKMTEREFRSVIRQMKHLESLTIIRSSHWLMQETCAPDCDQQYNRALANVKLLCMEGDMNEALWHVLSSIRALESLKYSGYSEMILFDIPRLVPECSSNVFKLKLLERHLPHLRELDLSGTLIYSAQLEKLSEMADGQLNLQRLCLASCEELGIDFGTFLETQPNLLSLDLSYTETNDDCVLTIADSLPLLEDLDISNNAVITNIGAIALRKLKRLKRLNLSHCYEINDEGIIQGIAAQENTTLWCLNLKQLSISIDAITAIAKNLQALRVLDLCYCGKAINDQVVQTIIENLPKLREFSLAGCLSLTDAALTGLNISKYDAIELSDDMVESSRAGLSIAHMLGLQKLVLRECYNLTDITLQHGIKLKRLRVLDLSFCQQITCRGLNALVRHSPAIEDLNLSKCIEINDEAVVNITVYLTQLKQLNIDYCEKLTGVALDAIKDNCKNLKTLSIYHYQSKTLREAIHQLRQQTLRFEICPYY